MEADAAVVAFREDAVDDDDLEWKWGLRAEPKQCRKETAPSLASPAVSFSALEALASSEADEFVLAELEEVLGRLRPNVK